MISNCIPNLGAITSSTSISAISTVIQQNGADSCFKTYAPTTDTHYQEKPGANQPGNDHVYLHVETIQKMVQRLLTEGQIPKEKLAKNLGITIENLKQLCSKKIPSALIPRINLPLVKLYCRSQF